jgi:hypothetical protein
MLWAVLCSSSGGQIVLLQHLVSSLPVNSCTIHWLRADSVCSQPAYYTATELFTSPSAHVVTRRKSAFSKTSRTVPSPCRIQGRHWLIGWCVSAGRLGVAVMQLFVCGFCACISDSFLSSWRVHFVVSGQPPGGGQCLQLTDLHWRQGKRQGLGIPHSVLNLVLNLRFWLGMVYPALAWLGLVSFDGGKVASCGEVFRVAGNLMLRWGWF